MEEKQAVRPDGVEDRIDGDTVRVFFWVDGVGYEVGGLEASDRPAIIDRIRRYKLEPLQAVGQELVALRNMNLPPDVREEIKQGMLDRAYKDVTIKREAREADDHDITHFLNKTHVGAAFSTFLMLKKHTPTMTEELAGRITERIGQAVVLKLRDRVSKRLIEAARKKATELAAAEHEDWAKMTDEAREQAIKAILSRGELPE